VLVSIDVLVDDRWQEKHPLIPLKPGRLPSLSEARFSRWRSFRSNHAFIEGMIWQLKDNSGLDL